MRRVSGNVALVLLAVLMAMGSVAEAEAKLKKVPVDGKAKVVTPDKLEFKKIRPGKAIAKKRAPMATTPRAHPAPAANPVAIPVADALGDRGPSPLVPAADSAPLVEVETIDAPRPTAKAIAPRPSPRDPKVYNLSASAPTQIEVSKLKKKTAKKRRARGD